MNRNSKRTIAGLLAALVIAAACEAGGGTGGGAAPPPPLEPEALCADGAQPYTFTFRAIDTAADQGIPRTVGWFMEAVNADGSAAPIVFRTGQGASIGVDTRTVDLPAASLQFAFCPVGALATVDISISDILENGQALACEVATGTPGSLGFPPLHADYAAGPGPVAVTCAWAAVAG